MGNLVFNLDQEKKLQFVSISSFTALNKFEEEFFFFSEALCQVRKQHK